jgi:hypothetical protein
LQLDVLVTPAGWKMQFFNSNNKGSREQVRAWLKERDIDFETSVGIWRIYTGTKNSHPYETGIEDVRTWTIDMLKRLTTVTSTVDRSTDLNTIMVTSSSAVDAVASLN